MKWNNTTVQGDDPAGTEDQSGLVDELMTTRWDWLHEAEQVWVASGGGADRGDRVQVGGARLGDFHRKENTQSETKTSTQVNKRTQSAF